MHIIDMPNYEFSLQECNDLCHGVVWYGPLVFIYQSPHLSKTGIPQWNESTCNDRLVRVEYDEMSKLSKLASVEKPFFGFFYILCWLY